MKEAEDQQVPGSLAKIKNWSQVLLQRITCPTCSQTKTNLILK